MRKFEQHDGKLWLMLDKPVPLTLDAKPSEIIVKITLEGTVRPGINESCFEISTPNGGWATIGKDEITADELELVESLLKAQEEG